MTDLLVSDIAFELTSAQRSIWIDQRFYPDQPIFVTAQAVAIEGNLDVAAFTRALSRVIAESDGLRIKLDSDSGSPRQIPVAAALDLPCLDFTSEADPEAAAQRWMEDALSLPISTSRAPLFRFALLRVGAARTIWFQKFHHLIIDATGCEIVTRRTASLYTALVKGAVTARVQGGDMYQAASAADAAYRASPRYDADFTYWLRRFDSLPAPLVQADRARSARAMSGRPARLSLRWPRLQFEALAASAKSQDTSMFNAIVALIAVAFGRLFGESDLCLGLALDQRAIQDARNRIGLYTSTLPLRVRVARSATLAEIIRAVGADLRRDQAHSRFPFQDLSAALHRSGRGAPGLFDVVLDYRPANPEFDFAGATATMRNLSYGLVAPWLLTITEAGPRSDLELTVDYDQGLIASEEAARLLETIRIFFTYAAQKCDYSVGQLPMVGASAEEELKHLAAGPRVAMPTDATLASLCAEQASRTPDAVALVCGTQRISYAELHARAEVLARRLQALGAGPDILIGIALPRTVELVVAVLAVHKAGAAYLPLDPAYPNERIAYIVGDAAAPVILTQSALAPSFAATGATMILIDQLDDQAPDAIISLPAARPDHLAYVLYTSGSTGKPKPVGIEHRNVVNLIYWGKSLTAREDLEGILFSTSLNFDLSVFELFLPLAFGGRIVMVENLLALPTAPARDEVRLINSGPSLLDALLRVGGLPQSATTVVLAGEVLPRRLADRLFSLAPEIRLFNLYGPTETTVYCSGCQIRSGDRDEPSIGDAIWNCELHVLDADLQLLPRGATGELYIGGDCVGRGYLGRPERTAERFLPNPFGPGTLYHSGDRVRWRPDGRLEFLGRADTQVKINGIRVELGEIENVIAASPDIAETAVSFWRDDTGTGRLVAYLVARGGVETGEKLLRSRLECALPRHMLPDCYVWLEAMPTTPNGKLDRKALPRPIMDTFAPRRSSAPQSALEIELVGIWQRVLNRQHIGLDEDFIDLGGDSLAAINLFVEIERCFDMKLTVDVLTRGLTIRRLVEQLTVQPSLLARATLAPLQPHGKNTPFFCVHDMSGDVFSFYRLAMLLGTDRPVIGVRSGEHPDLDPANRSIEALAATYVDQILEHQPQGPFLLGGYSFGASIAYEMACQLTARGHCVDLVALIDGGRPDWRLTLANAVPALGNFLCNLPAWIREDLQEMGLRRVVANGMRLLRRLWGGATKQAPDVTHALDLTRYSPGQHVLFAAHHAALHAYRPGPYPGRVTVFRARAQPATKMSEDDSLGWRKIALGGADVHIVPGNHLTMLTEPRVHVLARVLRKVLEHSQMRGR